METQAPAKTCASTCKEFMRVIATPSALLHGTSMAVTEASHAAASALDDLYRRHGGDVYRYAYAVLGNHADAEDVTQTTFLNAYRSLEQGVRPRKPANWLLTIASNAIKQRFRAEQARPREVELDRDVASNGAEGDVPSVGELLTALAKIPPQQRQAIVLREFEGRSYKEIAEIIGVTTGALETLLFRARRSLTDELAHQLTCTEAQQAISRAADGRLGRKEKRRLGEHVAECPDCSQFARLQQRHRKALRGLALVPVPLSLTLFKGFEGSAAAATLPVAAGSVAVGTGAGLGGAAAGGGGVFAGGLAVKAAAVVAAAGVAGGVTVAGVQQIGNPGKQSPPPKSAGNGKSHQLHSQRSTHASARGLEQGKAIARGQTGNTPPGRANTHRETSHPSAAKTKTGGTRRQTPVQPQRSKSTKTQTQNGRSTGQSDAADDTSVAPTVTSEPAHGTSATRSNKKP
jgi:RNA polymerase sigma factor (sigma-70 family)